VNNIVISIIVPIYNTRAYLEQCIESVLNQTYKDFELILIDDGSTDDSLAICNKYKANDSRIKVYSKDNGGQGSARNLGLDVAQGDYITFVDSDDWVLPQLLQVLYDNLILNQADISCCGVYSNEDGSDKKNDSTLVIENNIEAISSFVRNKGCINHSPVAKLFKKETFSGVRFIELRGFEDAGTMYKPFVNANKVVAQNVSLYYYYQRADSTMHRPFSTKDYDRIIAYEEMEKGLLSSGKYRNAAIVVTEAKIGAIYYVAGECIRQKIDDRKMLLDKCRRAARQTLKMNNGISIKNKVILRVLLFSYKLFGFLYNKVH